MAMSARCAFLVAMLVAATALLAGCTQPGDGSPAGSPSSGSDAAPTPSASGATPSPTAPAVALPTDCRAILSDAVLAQLKDLPLNDTAFDPTGVQADGSLICVWADPQADTTSLTTTISSMRRGPALDMLNALVADDGFTCYSPDGGTRCEKTWQNEQYPVTDGRTLFWRDDVLIDTRYSNLAPSGYTDAIIASLWR